ncbi:cyclin A1 [Pelomyxa schiedti]|nr:cyclin A1 [Pelomyxa schiedti]
METGSSQLKPATHTVPLVCNSAAHHETAPPPTPVQHVQDVGTATTTSDTVRCPDLQNIAELNALLECYKLERQHHVNSRCLYGQIAVTDWIRARNVNWLCEVADLLQLKPDVLFFAVMIMDKFMSLTEDALSKSSFLLLSNTALVIAAKSKDDRDIKEALTKTEFLADKGFSVECLEAFVPYVCLLIGFDKQMFSSTPTTLFFLQLYSRAARNGEIADSVSNWLAELSLLDYGMLRFFPSLIAAGCVYLARRMTGAEPLWPDDVRECSFYTALDLGHCARALNQLVRGQLRTELTAIKKKYSSGNPWQVAAMFPPLSDL